MRGSKNSKLATLTKLAKGVKEAAAKMKLKLKKFCQEKKMPSSSSSVRQPNLPLAIERCELSPCSPGFKIYEDWEPFRLNISQPSNLNSSPRLPSYREDDVNMAPDKSDVIIWRVSGRNNTVEKWFLNNRDAIKAYQHSRAVDV